MGVWESDILSEWKVEVIKTRIETEDMLNTYDEDGYTFVQAVKINSGIILIFKK
jgi:hypothetical protein